MCEESYKKVVLDVPKYDSQQDNSDGWVGRSKIIVALIGSDGGFFRIAANQYGLMDLARVSLYLAQDDAPNGASIRLTEKNGLMKGSIDLKIRKEESNCICRRIKGPD